MKSNNETAFIFRDESFSYQDLFSYIEHVDGILSHLPDRSVVAIESFDSPMGFASLLSALKRHIAVPMLPSLPENVRHLQKEIAQVEYTLRVQDFAVQLDSTEKMASHDLYRNLKSGLVLFSSGITAEPKGIVHDFHRLAKKFETKRKPQRLLQFLLFDHIGGINTALSALNSGSSLVLLEKKDPITVAQAIERHKVEILPTSPSFLQWLLLSREIETRDLSSLKLVTYGTEPMPASTLNLLSEKLRQASFKQTYGLSETGILSSQSRSDNSVWLRLKDEHRVQNGLLEIRTPTSMLGYLNAESPFTEDGWFRTLDAVEIDGEYLHILGRQTDLMNVAGIKVSPIEVETILLEMPEVLEATVYGDPNPLLGTIVKARVFLSQPLPIAEFRTRMRLYCDGKLEACKIPQAVELLDSPSVQVKLKKLRPRSI